MPATCSSFPLAAREAENDHQAPVTDSAVPPERTVRGHNPPPADATSQNLHGLFAALCLHGRNPRMSG
jgi:hypothetical protein